MERTDNPYKLAMEELRNHIKKKRNLNRLELLSTMDAIVIKYLDMWVELQSQNPDNVVSLGGK